MIDSVAIEPPGMWSPTSVERTVAFFENITTVPKDEVHDCVARWKWQLGSVGRVA